MDPKSLYGKGALFHGPAFQGIVELTLHASEGVRVQLATSLLPILDKAFYGRLAQWIDMAFQATALFGLAEHKALYLPVSIGQVHWLRTVKTAPLSASLQVLSHSDESIRSNAVLEDRSGPFLTLKDMQLNRRERIENHQLKIRPIKK